MAWAHRWKAFIALAMNATTTLLDALLPPRTRTLRMRAVAHDALPLVPTNHRFGHLRVTTLLDYRTRAVGDAIYALKYEGSERAARLLAAVLCDFLREEVATMRAFSPRPILIVPVPLYTSRRRERGFNQIERVLSHLPSELRDGHIARVMSQAASRLRATPQQTRLQRHERLANVAGAFAADERLVRGAHVILIDDVTTTGATLSACATALHKAGAKVTAVALARA